MIPLLPEIERHKDRSAGTPQTILPIFPQESTPINDVLSFVNLEGTVWYFHGCLPVFSHDEKDYRSFSMFVGQLAANGQCKQVEIVKAFGISGISVKRHVKKFREGGPGAFFKQRSGKRSTLWTAEVLRQAQDLLNEGKTRQEVAELLDIKPDTVYRALRSGQLVELKKKRANQE